MKNDRINYLVVGTFVITAFAVLIGVLFYITGNTGEKEKYYSVYNNISGVKRGTPVTFEGYRFGQVVDIKPQQTDNGVVYKIIFSVDKGWKIPADSVSRILASGLLAAIVIDIKQGVSKDYISAGGEITSKPGGNIMKVISNMAADINQITKNGLKPLIDNLNQSFGDGLPQIMDKLDNLLNQLNASAGALNEIMNSSSKDKVVSIINNTEDASKNFAILSDKINHAVTSMNKVIYNTGTLVDSSRPDLIIAIKELRTSMEIISQNIDTIVHNMNATSRNMNEFSRQIRQNPGLLLGGAKLKEGEAGKHE
ncbi:MAG: MlaD family protein [Gammaproteobacteria bacterium]|nr:MlaD family protein [Gammaproteobacteria bacterium]